MREKFWLGKGLSRIVWTIKTRDYYKGDQKCLYRQDRFVPLRDKNDCRNLKHAWCKGWYSTRKISKLAETTRINYLNAVCDAVWESLSVSSPNLSDRFHIALLSPRIAGLPDEFTTEYLSAHGISAGVVFGLMYFAVTGKSVEIKHFKTMSMLNHYQNDLMNEVLIEFKQ